MAGPGLVANSYLEGSYTERYPAIERNRNGMQRLFRQFSWPHGIPSHVSPETPGSIHEGGELGYSLAHAYGAAFDNPDLIVACVVGDGEAETGALATSWHSNKFLNPARDGAVLPILHLNGFKIANPTVLARISRQELTDLMRGYGYEPHFVEGDDPGAGASDARRHARSDRWPRFAQIQTAARARRRHAAAAALADDRAPHAEGLDRTEAGRRQAGRRHLARASGADRGLQESGASCNCSKTGCSSYRPEELFDADGKFRDELAALAPTGHRRMGANPHANGGELLQPLSLPHFHDYAVTMSRPGSGQGRGDPRARESFSRDVMKLNLDAQNFRLFGPDETASNRLDAVLEVTDKEWMAEIEDVDINLSPDGRVMEVLSEHLCQGWLEGYLLTGRHGLFSCYEAFIHIIDSMFNQHAKWLKVVRRRSRGASRSRR